MVSKPIRPGRVAASTSRPSWPGIRWAFRGLALLLAGPRVRTRRDIALGHRKARLPDRNLERHRRLRRHDPAVRAVRDGDHEHAVLWRSVSREGQRPADPRRPATEDTA